MKKQKLITRICTFTLAASLIATNAFDTFAAAPEETSEEEMQSTEENFDDGITPPQKNNPNVTEENDPTSETEQSNETEATLETPKNTEVNPETSDNSITNLETPTSIEANLEIPDEAEETPGAPNDSRKNLENSEKADTNPENTPNSTTGREPETTSGIQAKDDGLIYCMDGTLYDGYYMDSTGILYIVTKGIPEPANGIVAVGASYYKLPSNESITLQKQTVFVNGKLYLGYFMDNSNMMYHVSDTATELVTGILEKDTSYYNLSAKGNMKLSQPTLYINGKLYTGYFMDSESKMYHVKNGALTPATGTLKANTAYYSYKNAKTQKLSKPTLYVNGKLYTGYYLNSKNKMYRVKKGSLTLITGTLKAKTKYYNYKSAKTQKLSKQTLYVKGKPYTGYYLNSKNKMYRAKKGSLTLFTGTLKAKTKYYSYKKAKTLTLSKSKLYVKGKVYTGYYLNSKNKMYRAKKGSLTLITGTLGTGTKYYSQKANKTQTLSAETLYIKGKIYTGYYLNPENRMYRAEKGICSLVNATLNAGTRYYSYSAKKTLTLSASTVYVNGKAMEGMSPESLATLQRAQAVVASITNDSMTQEEKLRVCFDFVKTYREGRPRTPHYIGMDWPVIYANDMFVNGFGNCCSYAAAFAYMAKAIGYEEVYCCNDSGHGWAEIDGLIYDPEWSIHHDAYSYYALSYDTKTDVDYKGNIAAGQPWMRIKI